MVTYFDLRVDPHQLRNLLHTLADHEINYMHSQVQYSCFVGREGDIELFITLVPKVLNVMFSDSLAQQLWGLLRLGY